MEQKISTAYANKLEETVKICFTAATFHAATERTNEHKTTTV